MQNGLRSFLAIAGAVVLAGAALSVIGAYERHFLDFFGQFAIQAIVAAAGLTILFAILRRPALAAVSIAVGVAGYFAVAIPTPVEPCVAVPTHRLLFFNVWDGNSHTTATVDFVARQNADLIVLTEVNPRFRPALGELRKLYPYALECPEAEKKCQFYIYSRVPLAGEIDQLSRALVKFTAEFPEAKASLAGIHAIRPFPFHLHRFQLWQVSYFARLIANSPKPRIIVGDFNAVPWGDTINAISRITDVKPLPSRGTWFAPMPWPLRIPIDNVLIGDGIACAKKTVGPSVFSDHRPIWIDFAFKPDTARPAH